MEPARNRPEGVITVDDVRRLATALPEVTERTSYGTPAFCVAGKIFARIHEEPHVLVCWRDSLEDRDVLLAADPATFFTTDHYTGHASVLVRLDRVELDELAELLIEAWDARAPKRLRAARE
ncbi:MAG TPA: MmcQ/YjbR family DNA-binding protein [Candidatus Brevibacterium intestinigallinarum]|nr:MmcQ/YjbR family DNA-binding protein [Candidatus Brevibacterium intestinigallinarum]